MASAMDVDAGQNKVYEYDSSSSDDSDDLDFDEDDVKEARLSDFLFEDFLFAVTERVRVARRTQILSSMPQSKAEHLAYWRAFYQQLRQDAAVGLLQGTQSTKLATSEEAKQIQPLLQNGPCFDPPCRSLGLAFREREDAGHCPCVHKAFVPEHVVYSPDAALSDSDQPESSASAVSRQGITFDILLKQLCESLYGTEDDNGTSAVCGTSEDSRIVFHSFGYMRSDGKLMDGNLYIYLDEIKTGLGSIDAPDHN